MRVYPRCHSTDDDFSKQHKKFMKNINIPFTTLSNCMISACIDGIENKGIKIKNDARLLAYAGINHYLQKCFGNLRLCMCPRATKNPANFPTMKKKS
jgi:hypothetical protein